MTDQLKVLVICGSLRKGSYNAALARMAPKLAPPALSFSDAPSFAEMPIYNFDTQNTSGFPATVTRLGGCDPRGGRDFLRVARIQLDDPGRPQERDRLGVAHEGPAVRRQADALCSRRPAACSAARACSITCASR